MGQLQFAELLQPILQEIAETLAQKPVAVIHNTEIVNGCKIRKVVHCWYLVLLLTFPRCWFATYTLFINVNSIVIDRLSFFQCLFDLIMNYRSIFAPSVFTSICCDKFRSVSTGECSEFDIVSEFC